MNSRRPRSPKWRWIRRGAIAALITFLAIQLVPYGHDHTNPATTREPAWDRPRTRMMFMDACGDCHSNQTRWPWYTNVAPFSWLVQRDVDAGRAQFNVSVWDRPQDVSAGDVAEAVRGGSMPPWFYTPLHSGASLTADEKQQLITGLARTFAASPPIGGH